ncbi:MAG: hemerythrin domain-containing protein [Chroococcus sp. CMT-3BRIN-NPC107]|jgi:ribosomal protein S16|nr:hemerythrin domain-containing protein [Chroococcus sp. CMT-3BRIN-NPC107]
MNIINLITQEYQIIQSLFLKIENTQQTEKLYEFFNQISHQIITHYQAEELTLYSLLSKDKDSQLLVDEAKKAHQVATALLEEIEAFSPTSSEFKTRLQELKKAVQAHLQQGNIILERAQTLISKQEQEQLGKEFVTIKNKLQAAT